MRREEARALARALMDGAGLGQWAFRFDRAKRRAGSCAHATRTISLSGPLTDIYDEATVRAVVLHEIAHALVGPSQGHGARWREAARAPGAPDSATPPGAQPAPDAPWVGTCPACGAQRRLFRAPRRVASCGACARVFDADRILTWTRDGAPATPGGAYARELARVRRSRR